MYMVNIQHLSDKDYSKAIPEGYVINVKALEMKKTVVQVAKKVDTDKFKVYHLNTEEFSKAHPDVVEGYVAYVTDPVTQHVDLIAMTEPAAGLTDAMTEITGRMLHRTQTLASRLRAEARRAKKAANEEAAEPETKEENVESIPAEGESTT